MSWQYKNCVPSSCRNDVIHLEMKTISAIENDMNQNWDTWMS